MTEIIKQRLVGMLIVVIAGVVFLPDLLDGQKQLTKEEFKKVPAKPEIDEQPILTEFPADKVSAALAQAPKNDQKADDEPKPVTPPPSSNDTLAEEKAERQTSTVVVNTLKEEGLESTASTIENKPAASSVDKPSAFKQPAWILQLGSFKHKENVNSLRQKLADAGFKTFIKPVQTKSGVLSKVYIGPELEKETLIAAQAKLKELVGLQGKITRYDPLK